MGIPSISLLSLGFKFLHPVENGEVFRVDDSTELFDAQMSGQLGIMRN